MGLDMSIYGKTELGEEVELVYWRKANQIRNWFVRNLDCIDNNEKAPLTKSVLESLLSDIEKVLANPSLAESVLPTQSGFFFGSTDYAEWYLMQLEHSISPLREAIISFDGYSEVYYYESW